MISTAIIHAEIVTNHDVKGEWLWPSESLSTSESHSYEMLSFSVISAKEDAWFNPTRT